MDDRFAGLTGPEDPFDVVNEARIKRRRAGPPRDLRAVQGGVRRLKPKRKRAGSEPKPVIPKPTDPGPKIHPLLARWLKERAERRGRTTRRHLPGRAGDPRFPEPDLDQPRDCCDNERELERADALVDADPARARRRLRAAERDASETSRRGPRDLLAHPWHAGRPCRWARSSSSPATRRSSTCSPTRPTTRRRRTTSWTVGREHRLRPVLQPRPDDRLDRPARHRRPAHPRRSSTSRRTSTSCATASTAAPTATPAPTSTPTTTAGTTAPRAPPSSPPTRARETPSAA